jgi:hypothetical protein
MFLRVAIGDNREEHAHSGCTLGTLGIHLFMYPGIFNRRELHAESDRAE